MKRGLTLAETVVALFVLLTATAIFLTLLHTMLQRTRRSRLQMQATLAAESRLAQVEAEIRRLGMAFYQPAAWAAVLSLPAEDPAFPGVRLEQSASDLVVATPCSALELPYAPGQRLFTHCSRQLEVTAHWGNNQQFRLITAVDGPLPVAASLQVVLEVGSLALPLPRSATLGFRAELRDSADRAIPDVSYAWYVKAITGSATVRRVDRLGLRADLTHQLFHPDGSPILVGADPLSGGPRRCKVRVRCHYGGKDVWGESDEVRLAP